MLRDVLRNVASRLPASVLRTGGRWLLRGPRRRALRDRIASRLGSGEIVVRRGRLKGARLLVTGSNPGYALGVSEPAVQDALAQHLHPGAVVFDVGANIGFLTLVAARLVGPTGHVYAFEPVPENVALLRHNLARNGADNVTVLEIALGAASGRGRMDVQGTSDGGLTAALSQESPSADGAAPAVTVEAADALVAAGTCRPPDLVKIDVEGAEAAVLTGMRSVLEDHAPIVICEVHDADRHGALWLGVRLPLEKSGHALSELEPDENGMPHLIALPAARRGGGTA